MADSGGSFIGLQCRCVLANDAANQKIRSPDLWATGAPYHCRKALPKVITWYLLD